MNFTSNEMLYKVGFFFLVLVGTTAIAVLLLNSKFVRKKYEKISTNKKSKKIFCKGNVCVANDIGLSINEVKYSQFR